MAFQPAHAMINTSVSGLSATMQNKETTKLCPQCGNDKLLLLRSLNLKYCTDCHPHVKIPWYLEDGQKPMIKAQR